MGTVGKIITNWTARIGLLAIRFEAGQVWRVLGRRQDGDAHVAVLAVIEDVKLGQICAIAMTGVHIRNAFVEGGVQTQLPHAPVAAEVLRAAVIELVESDGPTADDIASAEAYLQWREPYDAGEAGVFTIPLNEILDVIEQAAAAHG
ncbi:MAG: hypothetical protein AB7U75_09685 [Hyphomicrobiaceae bacterium]